MMIKKSGYVRIIGGKWRGKKLYFPSNTIIRPTTDRIRETVFNWLAPVICDANCLDLFAGSGALSFEALSRGAASAVMIDQSAVVVAYLKQQIQMMHIENAWVYQATIPTTKKLCEQLFDVIFIDPPFQQGLISHSCAWLEQQNMFKSSAYIYIEAEKQLDLLSSVPTHWQLLRSKFAGCVGYHLFLREGSIEVK